MPDEERIQRKITKEFGEAVKYAHPKVSREGIATLERLFDGKAGPDEVGQYVIWWARTAFRDPLIRVLADQIMTNDKELYRLKEPKSVYDSFVRDCWISLGEALAGDPTSILELQLRNSRNRLEWLERILARIKTEIAATKRIIEYIDRPQDAPPEHLSREGISKLIGALRSGPRGEDSLQVFAAGLRQELGLKRAPTYKLARALRLTRKTNDRFNDWYTNMKLTTMKVPPAVLPAQVINTAESIRKRGNATKRMSRSQRTEAIRDLARRAEEGPTEYRMKIRIEPVVPHQVRLYRERPDLFMLDTPDDDDSGRLDSADGESDGEETRG